MVRRGRAFSLQTVCQLGITILRQFESLHKIGKVYNNLNLNNIVTIDGLTNGAIDTTNTDSTHLQHPLLTNLCFCSDYLDTWGNHIQPGTVTAFKGNIAFSSVYAMGFLTPSRRDDLISLAYLLIYLVQGRLSILQNVNSLNKSQSFQNVYEAKMELTAAKLCSESPLGMQFIDFVTEIFNLEFADSPNYFSLAIKLLDIMFKNGVELTNEYDWSSLPPQKTQFGQ